jgi:hypothetical protein
MPRSGTGECDRCGQLMFQLPEAIRLPGKRGTYYRLVCDVCREQLLTAIRRWWYSGQNTTERVG